MRNSGRPAASAARTSSSTSNADLLDILEHRNPEPYADQRSSSSVATITVYLVPFVEDGRTVFLKTIIPATRQPGSDSAR